ncbi:MAG: hypothetical protein SVK08_01015 [Halobacteriota archaeon]|nr:hypothetical protein [Halobacteriota archaeon]
MKAQLTLTDRFAALEILPTTGNFATWKIVRKLQEQLSLTEEEIKEYRVVEQGDMITWENNTKTAEIEFGEFAEAMIRERLISMDKDQKLESRHYRLYELFVEDNYD